MAKTNKAAAGGGKEAGADKGPSTLMSIVSLVILTLIAAGAGGFFGMQLKQMQTEGPVAAKPRDAAGAGKSAGGHGPAPGAAHGEKAAKAHGDEGEPVPGVALLKLAPIITNMAAPGKTWIRLEAALVFPGGLPEKAEFISGKITDDIVAYLRTVKLRQIEGASGFLNLREDLNERVRIRSESKVSEIVIQAFIVE